MIITGENTITIHRLVNRELGRVITSAVKVEILNAGHGSVRENPSAFNAAVLDFLTGLRTRNAVLPVVPLRGNN
jgi:pimeloyl-ACP methyl ester carboxylesterase